MTSSLESRSVSGCGSAAPIHRGKMIACNFAASGAILQLSTDANSVRMLVTTGSPVSVIFIRCSHHLTGPANRAIETG